MLHLQIVSDLHLEFWPPSNLPKLIRPSAPILALLGDTCCVGSDSDYDVFCRYIRALLPSFEHILIVPGNHEYYTQPRRKGYDMRECNARMRTFCGSSPKLHFMHNTVWNVRVGKTRYAIIGSVLWSSISPKKQRAMRNLMSDYKYVQVGASGSKSKRRLTPADVNKMFCRNVRFIRAALSDARKKNEVAIVLTHHKPYLSETSCAYQSAYESDCSALFTAPLALWCYGHTHRRDYCTIGGTTLVSNPKGYPRQRTRFSHSQSILVRRRGSVQVRK
ncbi:metallophosphoesterase [Candidatus Gracilibacteria bacterium]|nr:metallophosphoesterase [Candidatus Gracilibacteria bacterium]